jgi:diaminopimelate decarboxylase
MSLFDTRGGQLYFDDVNLPELAAEYGTPLYVLSRTQIRERIAELRFDFLDKYPNAQAAYASKAFLARAMCEIIDEEGLSLDVVSGGELYTAVQAEFPAGRIEFHGNNKLYDELDMAIDYGVGLIIIDAFGELEMIEELAQKYKKKVNILFRINPAVDTDTHEYISTGFKGSKFGFPAGGEVTQGLLKRALDSPHVTLKGIHFHIGSQLFENKSHLDALSVALQMFKDVRDLYGYELPRINIGGGFGIRYTHEDERKPYRYFLSPVMDRVKEFCQVNSLTEPVIVVEPGRSIVGDAGLTLYTVGAIRGAYDAEGTKKADGTKKYVSIDGGMPDNIRPALYGARYEAVIAGKADTPKDDIVTIVGKCCETGDLIIDDAELQVAQRGDIIAVFSTGAYGYSMASNYNKLPVPAVVLVENGSARLIVRRQTYADMMSRDL